MPIPRRASVIAITIQKIICFIFPPTMARVPLSTSTRYEACTISNPSSCYAKVRSKYGLIFHAISHAYIVISHFLVFVAMKIGVFPQFLLLYQQINLLVIILGVSY